MKYQEMVKAVQEKGGFEKEQAEQALQVFMETLATRLNDGERNDFASQLPKELQNIVLEPTHVSDRSADGFYEEIGATQDIGAEEAKQQARLVWETLKGAITEGEISHIKAQLPKELEQELG